MLGAADEEINGLGQRIAEAKHSGLIAISSALLLAIPTLLKQPKNKWNRLLYILPSISFAIALFISLSSFSPITKLTIESSKKVSSHNHYFFESLANMDVNEFKKEFIPKGDSLSHLQTDLIDQVIINSKITSKKMSSFKTALLFFKIGFLLLGIIYLSSFVFVKQQ